MTAEFIQENLVEILQTRAKTLEDTNAELFEEVQKLKNQLLQAQIPTLSGESKTNKKGIQDKILKRSRQQTILFTENIRLKRRIVDLELKLAEKEGKSVDEVEVETQPELVVEPEAPIEDKALELPDEPSVEGSTTSEADPLIVIRLKSEMGKMKHQLTRRIKDLEQQLIEKESIIMELRTIEDEKIVEIPTMDEVMEGVTEKATLQNELDIATENSHNVQSKLVSYMHEVEKLSNQLRSALRVSSMMDEQLENKTKQISELEKHIEEVEKRYNDLDSTSTETIQRLRDQLLSIQKNNTSQSSNLKTNISSLSQEIDRLVSENRSLRHSLQIKHSTTESAAIKILEVRNQTLQEELNVYKTQRSRMDDRIREADLEMHDLRLKNENLQNDKHSGVLQNSYLTAQIEELRGQVRTSEDGQVLLRKRIEEHVSEIKRVKKELAVEMTHVKNLNETISSIKEAHISEKEGSIQQIRKLRDEKKSYQKKYTVLQDEFNKCVPRVEFFSGDFMKAIGTKTEDFVRLSSIQTPSDLVICANGLTARVNAALGAQHDRIRYLNTKITDLLDVMLAILNDIVSSPEDIKNKEMYHGLLVKLQANSTQPLIQSEHPGPSIDPTFAPSVVDAIPSTPISMIKRTVFEATESNLRESERPIEEEEL
ncbi:hypothetical protein PCE1_002045 [Barthelona sp. PCE]